MLKSQRTKRPVWSSVVNAFLIALAFGLLGLAVYRNRLEFVDVFRRGIDARLFMLAIVSYMTAIIPSFVRWSVLVRVIDPRFTRRDALLLGFIGNVFNLVIPGGVGGDFVKAAYLVKMDIKRTQAIASMVIDRLLGLIGLFLVAGVAGVVAWPLADRPIHILIVLVWIAVLAGLLVLSAIFNPSLTRAFLSLAERHGRGGAILREMRMLSDTYRKRPGLVAAVLAWCCGIHLLFVIAFFLVSLAIFRTGIPGFGQHLLIVPLILFSTAVPMPFGALGLSEHVSERLFALVGHPRGMLAMMGYRVLMYCGGLISAGVYLAHFKQVRALTDTAEKLDEELSQGDLDDEGRPGSRAGLSSEADGGGAAL
jgi:glycosyltransferase 2 family protein